jgi:large subunit ribosomal protein L29
MRPEEIRELADADIAKRIEDLSQELFDLRMKLGYEEPQNPNKIRQLKRDIARLKTIMQERARAAARSAKEN